MKEQITKRELVLWHKLMHKTWILHSEYPPKMTQEIYNLCKPVTAQMEKERIPCIDAYYANEICDFIADKFKEIIEGAEPFMPLDKLIEISEKLVDID